MERFYMDDSLQMACSTWHLVVISRTEVGQNNTGKQEVDTIVLHG